ncbi:family 43 glycosylhydrolase [Microbispora sitophila]|uniref:family 43 glycosylhydrolase n=1 Tax=Microbispora sitophila TaxID=2771537 RepID=UPI001D028338|nr:family 43 glycosylhydrolase [Microbispora sitophila]
MGARVVQRRIVQRMVAACAGLVCLLTAAPAAAAPPGPAGPGSYVNPVSRPFADTFADPSIIKGEDGWWYAYGTSDPLREGERTPHYLPISRSRNLSDWTYVGDAFSPATLPKWADTAGGASLWAPDVRRVNGEYRLYYVVTQTTVTPEPNDNAIGVATAPTPAGPWTDSGAPVVGPRHGPGGTGDFKWTFDPAHAVDTDGAEYLVYGSYYGGILITRLDATGTRAVGEPTMIAIDNRFEGGYLVRRGGYWYLFASSADCCAGPTTGYSVYAGRSRSITGPYVDREGVPLNTSRAGGTIVIAPNGNRWVGTGHNAVVTDPAGQDWLVYHAIDRDDPYLDEPYGINERPMLIDRLDWVDGWPTVRGGAWASEDPQRAPGRKVPVKAAPLPRLGPLDPSRSDEFDGRLRPGWTWVRAPQGELSGGALRWPTQDAELNRENNTASVLLREAPEGDWTAETKLTIDLGTDTVRNYQQAGLIAYAGDDLYTKLVHVAIWNTRQTEFGKEMPYAGRIAYGGTIVGPPADTTWLRLVHRVDRHNGEHELRAATSRDGRTWTYGGVWTLPADADLRVGLISLGGAGATAEFDYFHLHRR